MPIQRILVPIDFSETSDQALRVAQDLAKQLGASIRLLHVLETTDSPLGPRSFAWPASIEGLHRRFQIELERRATTVREAGIHCGSDVRDGSPGERIVEDIQAGHADLVVVSSHGRRGLSRVLFGSVTSQLLRDSRVPVLVVPAQPPQAVPP
jgi:nucleotide-binding universal stress UspA family protein